MGDVFGIIAEFSIGLAGFSGIVALIGNVHARVHRFRVSNLLRGAFTPGFCGLAGMLFIHLGLDEESVIRLTSAVLGMAVLANLVAPVRVLRRFDEPAREALGRGVFWFQVSGLLLNILAQLFNCLVVTDYAAAILIGGLIQQLLGAAVTFSRIVDSLLRERVARP